MTNEKLEKLMRKGNKIFDMSSKEINAIPVGEPIILRGLEVGYEIIDQIDKHRAGYSSLLKNKPKEANGYCELERWNSEWTADSIVPCVKIQYYKIIREVNLE